MSGVEFAAETPTAATPSGDPPPPDEAAAEHDQVGKQRLGSRSLTSRLVVGVGGLAVVLVAIIGGGTYYELRTFLFHRLDSQLGNAADANAQYFSTCLHTPQVPGPNNTFRCPITGPVGPSREWIALVTAKGTAGVHSNSNVSALTLSHDDAQQILSSPSDVREIYVNGTKLHVTASRVTNGVVVATGLSTVETYRTLHRVLLVELIIGGSAIGLALIATYAGVRFSLRGLRRVTTTAQEVATELGPSGVALQRRVPVTEHGTEVAQLTDSMNTLLQATETQFAARVESEERMRQFLADASHELRTPLTSIRGYAELARMQRAAGQANADNIDRIEAEGTRMSRLVEDLLMLARGTSGGDPRRELVDVREFVDDAVAGARAAFPGRDIEQEATVPINVVGDPDQLLRIVRNLVTNAAVHTAASSPIRVRAFRWDDPLAGVAIQVIDGGPGLAPDEAAHVFERFWRADKARSRARGGSGLGLSIVSSIVSAHGGTVRFDSSVEAGSTVTVWLPVAP